MKNFSEILKIIVGIVLGLSLAISSLSLLNSPIMLIGVETIAQIYAFTVFYGALILFPILLIHFRHKFRKNGIKESSTLFKLNKDSTRGAAILLFISFIMFNLLPLLFLVLFNPSPIFSLDLAIFVLFFYPFIHTIVLGMSWIYIGLNKKAAYLAFGLSILLTIPYFFIFAILGSIAAKHPTGLFSF